MTMLTSLGISERGSVSGHGRLFRGDFKEKQECRKKPHLESGFVERGTDVMIFKIFSSKNCVFAQITASFVNEKNDHNIVLF
jgi:hypothetical protein